MYLAIAPKKTCAAAWLEATAAVNEAPRHEAHNVIIDVEEPLAQSAADTRVVELADSFLQTHRRLPIQSVANTIFPEALYHRHGAPDFMDKFHKELLPRIRSNDRWSGYYFERMTAYPTHDAEPLNQLWGIVERTQYITQQIRDVAFLYGTGYR